MKLQYYLSNKSIAIKKYLEENGGTLLFKDCICKTKNSLIPIFYKAFCSFKDKKKVLLGDLFYKTLKEDEPVFNFVFENAVVIYELNTHMPYNTFIQDKYLFRECVEGFINYTYSRPFYNQVRPELRVESLKMLYELSDEFYLNNKEHFGEIALKRSRLNRKCSKPKSRYDKLTILKDGKQKSKTNHMKNLNNELLIKCYEMYKTRELRSYAAVAEYYYSVTGERIIPKTINDRLKKIASERNEDLESIRGRLSQPKKVEYNADVIPESLISVCFKMRNAGCTLNDCLTFLSGAGINVSQPTLSKYLVAYSEEHERMKREKEFISELKNSQEVMLNNKEFFQEFRF